MPVQNLNDFGESLGCTQLNLTSTYAKQAQYSPCCLVLPELEGNKFPVHVVRGKHTSSVCALLVTN